MKYVEKGTGVNHSVAYEFDKLNNMTALVETINGTENTTRYSYDEDNRPTSVVAQYSSRNCTYDGFGRAANTGDGSLDMRMSRQGLWSKKGFSCENVSAFQILEPAIRDKYLKNSPKRYLDQITEQINRD